MDTAQRAKAREQFLRHFMTEMSEFLVDRQDELIKQDVLQDATPGDFLILLTAKYAFTVIMQVYGVDDNHIEKFFDEYIGWIDRKVADYKARN